MDDRRLVKECLQGNAAAQRQFYEQFAPTMLAICYRYTKSVADAEDVLQEGFVKAFRSLQQYKGDGELGGWLRRIMVTTAINYLKKHSRYQTELLFSDEQLHAVSSYQPEVALSAKELADLIRQLPAGYQTIFNLHAVEGYTHVEIGQMLGIKEGTSRSQYARARALLIQWIEQQNTDVKNRTYAG
jgi:RNA polymerase sigma-70 factor (ECF subfamily)